MILKKLLKMVVPVLALSVFAGLETSAEQVKRLDFTGSTRTEKIVITISNKQQTLEYFTPSRDIKYSILDYDVQVNEAQETKTVTATILDPIFNTAYEVLLYVNQSYSDIRIGKKRITISQISDFRIQE